MELAREERAELAEFLVTLTPEQWDAPTLCTDWSVREVVAHVVSYEELGARGLAERFVAGRFRPNRMNQAGVDECATRSPEQLLAFLEQHQQPQGLTAGFGGMVALVDGLIHHQDIRRPMGRPREIPAERLRRTLTKAMIAPPIGAFYRARGLRLVATDVDWVHGRGAQVHGPGEAVLMAVAGRPDALSELSGPGVATLARRVLPR